MTYAGLTISDKPALLEAKARGAEWVARDNFMNEINGFIGTPRRKKGDGYWLQPSGTSWNETVSIDQEKLQFVQWDNPEPVNIDLALAQIAEMESKQNNALSEKANEKGCMTWNERINQMTLNERAFLSAGFGYIVERSRKWAASKYKFKPWKIQGAMEEYMRKFLNSPYTEGEKV